jgi:hypothetical protein
MATGRLGAANLSAADQYHGVRLYQMIHLQW